MAKRKKSNYTLEEILTLSNEELKSNWSKLTSLIRLYEYGDEQNSNQKNTWYPSRAKAIQLLENNSADKYIDRVRSNPNQWCKHEREEVESIPVQIEVLKSESKPKSNRSRPKQNIYQKNYHLLTTLIPDLEQRILEGKTIEGLSNVIGYHGLIHTKPIHRDKNQSILHLKHHIEDGERYSEETMMALRLDIIKMTLEPLAYQNRQGVRKVYHEKDNCKRELVHIEEQKTQNRLLSDWLKSLIHHKHKFTWQDAPNSEDNLYLRIMGLYPRNAQEFVPIEPEIDKNQLQLDDVNKIISEILGKQAEIERKIEGQEEQRRIKNEKRELERIEAMKLLNWKDYINDDIPNFNIGFVQLVQAHVKIGITQNDINWINKHKQGMIFTPRRDAKVKRHGFRISAVGKIFFKGRSNR
jgi:hypothetical protein